MSHGYGEARPIGRMVPQQATSEARPAAWCTKCGAKLSTWRDRNDLSPDARYCAPCQLALGIRPTFDPAATSAENARRHATNPRCRDCDKPLARNSRITAGTLCRACLNTNKRLERSRRHRCTDCGVEISHRAKRCEKCASPVRYIAGTKESCYCKCGSRKKNGAVMCYTCRYRRAA